MSWIPDPALTYFTEVFNQSVFRHKPLVGGLGDGTLVGDPPVDGALPPFERPRWPLLNGLDQTAYSSHTSTDLDCPNRLNLSLRLVAPLCDDDEGPRLVPLLPDCRWFAVVCARELIRLSFDLFHSYRPLGELSRPPYWER